MPTEPSPARPASLAPSDGPPQLQRRYALYRTLDESERGAVFLGYDQRLHRWRAVEVPADATWEQRLRQEAEVLARLEHPAVERVIDRGEEGQIAYVVRDRLQGSAAGHLPLRPSIACFVVLRIAEGLAHAHARGILHGHLRPSYIRFSEDGSPVLTGFGRTETVPIVAPGRTPGEEVDGWAFLAPEVRDGALADVRSEVYSLGAVLYTLITGREHAELCFAEAYPGLLTTIPSALRSVILRTCAYDPAERPANVDGFRMLLAPRTESLGSIGEFPWRTSTSGEVPVPNPATFQPDATLLALMRVLGPKPPPPPEDPFTLDEDPLRHTYIMSRPEPAGRERAPHHKNEQPAPVGLPSYIDATEAASVGARTFAPVTVDLTGTQRAEAPPAPRPPPARVRSGPSLTVLNAFAGSFAAALLLLAALAWFGTEGLRRDRRLVSAVQQEASNIDAIAEASADRRAIERAWHTFRSNPTAETATAFVHLSEPVAERFGTSAKTKAAIQRLTRAERAWRREPLVEAAAPGP